MFDGDEHSVSRKSESQKSLKVCLFNEEKNSACHCESAAADEAIPKAFENWL